MGAPIGVRGLARLTEGAAPDHQQVVVGDLGPVCCDRRVIL